MSYDQDEMKQLHELRKEQRAKWDADKREWETARVGFVDASKHYQIYYQNEGDPETQWWGASPFFETLSLNPDRTEDADHADQVAAAILKGEWPTHRGRSPRVEARVREVRIVEYIHTSKLVSQITLDDVL